MLTFSSQVLVRSFYIPFMVNTMLIIISMHKMHLHSITIASMGVFLSISNTSLDVATSEFVEYHTSACNTKLVEPSL